MSFCFAFAEFFFDDDFAFFGGIFCRFDGSFGKRLGFVQEYREGVFNGFFYICHDYVS